MNTTTKRRPATRLMAALSILAAMAAVLIGTAGTARADQNTPEMAVNRYALSSPGGTVTTPPGETLLRTGPLNGSGTLTPQSRTPNEALTVGATLTVAAHLDNSGSVGGDLGAVSIDVSGTATVQETVAVPPGLALAFSVNLKVTIEVPPARGSTEAGAVFETTAALTFSIDVAKVPPASLTIGPASISLTLVGRHPAAQAPQIALDLDAITAQLQP